MNSENDDGLEGPRGALLQGGEGVSGTFMGQIVFPFMGKTLGQREEQIVEDCTGRTQAKNKSQTTLKSRRTSSLPREVLILTRSTFVVSQVSNSGVLQKSSKASDRVIPTFVAQPPCCWGCHGCLQQLTPLDTAGHTCWDSTRNVQITLGEYFEKHSIFEGKICLASMCW